MSDNILTVSLAGEIDHHNIEPVREAVDGAILSRRPSLLILDFSKISFMDSSGFGFVMGRYKTMNSLGGQVIVRGSNKRIKMILELSGAGKYVTIE